MMLRLALAAVVTRAAAYEACRHKLEFEYSEEERVTQSVLPSLLRFQPRG